jgi:hypothetical protein
MKPAHVVALLCLLALPAFAGPQLEVEVGAGASGLSLIAPTFTGRVGVDLMGWFTPSLRVMSLTPLSGDTVGWSALAELRAHTPGVFQLTGGVGLGLATASFTRQASGAVSTQVSTLATSTLSTNTIAPYLFADLGVRVKLGPVFVGASVGGAPFANQYLALLSVGFAAFGS